MLHYFAIGIFMYLDLLLDFLNFEKWRQLETFEQKYSFKILSELKSEDKFFCEYI